MVEKYWSWDWKVEIEKYWRFVFDLDLCYLPDILCMPAEAAYRGSSFTTPTSGMYYVFVMTSWAVCKFEAVGTW